MDSEIDIMIEKNVISGPLVTYCLFAYNQEQYIRESLLSALSQTYEPLRIVVSDDCSTDGTMEIIEELVDAYTGGHEVVINRNESNMGIGAHVSKVVLELSDGKYIITVGGDDISCIDHVERAVSVIEAQDNVSVVDFSATVVDDEGRCLVDSNALSMPFLYSLVDYLKSGEKLMTFAPGRIVSRQMMCDFGCIASSCPTEDSVIVLRALLSGALLRVPLNLITYRRTGASASSGQGLRRMNLDAILEQYVADVCYALASGKISCDMHRLLIRRLNVELIVRKSHARFNQGSMCFYMYKLYAKICAVVYRFRWAFSKSACLRKYE